MATEVFMRMTAGSLLKCVCSLALALALSSCGYVDRIYTYQRKEPAMGRNSPTMFTVRIKIDEKKRVVSWLEDAADSDGYIGRSIKTYEDCAVFDRSNWKCVALPGMDEIEMKDGALRNRYWSDDVREFHSSYRFKAPTRE